MSETEFAAPLDAFVLPLFLGFLPIWENLPILIELPLTIQTMYAILRESGERKPNRKANNETYKRTSQHADSGCSTRSLCSESTVETTGDKRAGCDWTHSRAVRVGKSGRNVRHGITDNKRPGIPDSKRIHAASTAGRIHRSIGKPDRTEPAGRGQRSAGVFLDESQCKRKQDAGEPARAPGQSPAPVEPRSTRIPPSRRTCGPSIHRTRRALAGRSKR